MTTQSARILTLEEQTTRRRRENKSIILPWPDKRLSPNSRRAHRWLTDVRTIARNTGYFAAKEANLYVPDKMPLHLYLTFCPPDHRRRDDDNLIGSFKYYRDGIFKALGVDDSNVKMTTYCIGKKTEGGAVLVMIEVIPLQRNSNNQ